MASLEEYILMNIISSESDDDVEDIGAAADESQRSWISTSMVERHEKAFQMSNSLFKKNYRLTKPLVRALIEEMRPLSTSYRTSDLTVELKVLISLNFFATGSYQTCVGSHRNAAVSQASVSKSLAEVVDFLNQPNILNKYIKFPNNYVKMNAIAQKFYQLYGLPGVVGCIDCTHVAIYPPPNNEHYDERSYVNRKGYHSINVQLICDSNLYITNVNALFPGSTHDSYIWNQSAVQPVMKNIYDCGCTYYLIGDSGYALRPWLQVPIPEPINRAEERYNDAFKTARATIERCNGVLKGRFRCLLKHRVLHYSPEKVSKIINSCVVLHNICIQNNIEMDSEDDDDVDFGLYHLLPMQEPTQRANDLSAGQGLRALITSNYFN